MDIEAYIKQNITGKKCCVIGIGVSNIPLIGFLLKHGARVVACDARELDELPDAVKDYAAQGAELHLGDNYLADIGADIIFRSPGIRPDVPEIAAAVKAGASLSSEMELFFELCPARIFAVSGSDGKTTTTTVSYLMLEEEQRITASGGRVFVGGNIGKPLLPEVLSMSEKDFAVVELSSFQLQTMRKSASFAAITNISPNHLNWHTDMDEYTAAKLNLYQNTGCEYVVLNADNEITRELIGRADIKTCAFTLTEKPESINAERVIYLDGNIISLYEDGVKTPLLDSRKIRIPGRHNIANYMTAIGLTYDFISLPAIEKIATEFGGVEHRNEFVRTVNGVKYYNSSIDSSPTRTIAALRIFNQKVIVICGGRDKHIPFTKLAEEICERAKVLVLTGEAKEEILDAVKHARKYNETLKIIVENDFKDAVAAAKNAASAGDIVILSPACTAFDAFPNFEVRGRTFKQIVNEFKENNND